MNPFNNIDDLGQKEVIRALRQAIVETAVFLIFVCCLISVAIVLIF